MINRNPPAIPPTISPVWAKPSQISFISFFFLFTYVHIHNHSSLFYYRNIFDPLNLLSFENSNFCNVPVSTCIYFFYLFKSKDLQNILEDSIIESFPRREIKIVKKSDINSFFLFFFNRFNPPFKRFTFKSVTTVAAAVCCTIRNRGYVAETRGIRSQLKETKKVSAG